MNREEQEAGAGPLDDEVSPDVPALDDESPPEVPVLDPPESIRSDHEKQGDRRLRPPPKPKSRPAAADDKPPNVGRRRAPTMPDIPLEETRSEADDGASSLQAMRIISVGPARSDTWEDADEAPPEVPGFEGTEVHDPLIEAEVEPSSRRGIPAGAPSPTLSAGEGQPKPDEGSEPPSASAPKLESVPPRPPRPPRTRPPQPSKSEQPAAKADVSPFVVPDSSPPSTVSSPSLLRSSPPPPPSSLREPEPLPYEIETVALGVPPPPPSVVREAGAAKLSNNGPPPPPSAHKSDPFSEEPPSPFAHKSDPSSAEPPTKSDPFSAEPPPRPSAHKSDPAPLTSEPSPRPQKGDSLPPKSLPHPPPRPPLRSDVSSEELSPPPAVVDVPIVLDSDEPAPEHMEEISSEELAETSLDEVSGSAESTPLSERRPPPPPKRPPAPSVRSDENERRSTRRPWWEEAFRDDFVRADAPLTPAQISREVDFIEESLGVAEGGVVLDLCCGGGHHAVELSSRGYGVVGYDLSVFQLALAAEVAQERNQKINFLQGDVREMAFEEMFDGMFCWNTSFGYFEEEKNFNVAERMFRALRSGGMLLLDVMNRDFVAQQTPNSVWYEGDSVVCMDDMSMDFITSRLRVKRQLMLDDGRQKEINFSVRLYSLHELGKLLHDVGFRVTEATGHPAHPGVFFGAQSPRIIILAQKP